HRCNCPSAKGHPAKRADRRPPRNRFHSLFPPAPVRLCPHPPVLMSPCPHAPMAPCPHGPMSPCPYVPKSPCPQALSRCAPFGGHLEKLCEPRGGTVECAPPSSIPRPHRKCAYASNFPSPPAWATNVETPASRSL